MKDATQPVNGISWSRGWSIAATLAAILWLHGCGGDGSDSKVTVTGSVLDDAIAGAQVRISDASSGNLLGEGMTGPDGRYAVKVAKADAYRVESSGGNINGRPFAASLRALCGDAQRETCHLTPLTTLSEREAAGGGYEAYLQAQANQRTLLGLPAEDPFVTDSRGEAQTAVNLAALRTRIGDGTSLDTLLGEIVADLADGTLDASGSVAFYFPNARTLADEALERVEAMLRGDPSVQQSSDAEIEQLTAVFRTSAAKARQRRLQQNQELVLHALDPEPTWFSTRASSQMLIVEPGESHSVDLFKLDISGNSLGAVDKEKLRLEVRIQRDENTIDYVPTEYQESYVAWDANTAGRLNIHVPADLNRGRLLIGVRPDFADAGQAAIAERWSVSILADVWPLKANVTSVSESAVYYPVGSDAHLRAGSAFERPAISDALLGARLDELLKEEPLKALVVKGMNLQVGQLVDYRLPDAKGGIYPYGGRVMKVIAGPDDQQLVLVSFGILEVYDVLLGEKDQFVTQGVMPEFVSYRSGAPLPAAVESDTPPPSKFGPDDRAIIQADDLKFFETKCEVGTSAVVVTPSIKFDLDKGFEASIDYVFGFTGLEVSCKTDIVQGADYRIPLAKDPRAAVVTKALGTEITVGPYGQYGFTLQGGMGSMNFNVAGGCSTTDGCKPPELKWTGGGTGGGLDADPMNAKVTLTGEGGIRGKASAVDVELPFDLGSMKLSFEVTGGGYWALSGESVNAAAAKSGSSSSLAVEYGLKEAGTVSPDMLNFLNKVGMKVDLFKFERTNTLKKVVSAEYLLKHVEDGGTGQAQASIEPGSQFVQLGIVEGDVNGYASLSESSVYNDPNDSITYDVGECEDKGGTIATPLVACINDFFCAKLGSEAKLCGGQVYVDTIMASGKVGETVYANSTVGVRSGDADKQLSITVSGGPLVPFRTSYQLTPGQSDSIMGTATCGDIGVVRGNITASADNGTTDVQQNVLSCVCDGPDCDRTWLSPHLLTADGLAYDFIASGSYILQQVVDEAGVPIHGLEVQARFLPGYDVSWPQAAAMQVGDDVVEVYTGQYSPPGSEWAGYQNVLYVKVNGELQGPPHRWHAIKNGSRVLDLPSGGLIFFEDFVGRNMGATWDPRSLTVVWPQMPGLEGYGVKLSTPYFEGYMVSDSILAQLEIQLIRPSSHSGRERGMLGNNDGDPSNDFVRRNGEVLAQDSALTWTALYGLFGGDWLVKPQECLFSDGCLKAPDFPTSAAVLTPEQRAIGEAACSSLIGYYKEACVHDVGLSGSVELVQSYYANTDDLNWMATQLHTPGVDLPIYTLTQGERSTLPESTAENRAYRLGATVAHVMGEGKYLLSLRPPRGASVTFAAGYPGALGEHLTAEGDLSTAVDVHCGDPDPEWATLGDLWAMHGALQLWLLDPLSGFASQLVTEIPLSCTHPDNMRLLSAGYADGFALAADGRVFGWGYNAYGEAGDGTNEQRTTPVIFGIEALEGAKVVSVAAGEYHAIIQDDLGRLWARGNNGGGKLGDGTDVNRTDLVAVDLSALGGVEVVSVVAGVTHTLAMDGTGKLWAWGDNTSGQLGNSSTDFTRESFTPVEVDLTALGGARVVSIASRSEHAFALDDNGQLWAWGDNAYGQLGDGTKAMRSSPVMVNQSALEGARVVSVAAGPNHTLALDDAGRLWAFGWNNVGQLGNSSNVDSLTPVAVNLTAPEGSRFVAIATGYYHSLALDQNGQMWAWGANFDGQLGIGTVSVPQLTPVSVNLGALGSAKVVAMTAGYKFTIVLDDLGRLWSWGVNDYGQLGEGSTTTRTSPVLIGTLNGGVVEFLGSDVPATAMVRLGEDLALGSFSVKSRQLGGKTLTLPEAGFGLNAPGKSSALAAFGESALALYARCDTLGTQSRDYRLLDDAGAVLHAGSVSIACVADIQQLVTPSLDGGLRLVFTNVSAPDASLRFTAVDGVTVSGMQSWEGTLSQLANQTLAVSGVGCPFSGQLELGTLAFLDDQGQVYGQQTVTASGGICVGGTRLSAGSSFALALNEWGGVAAWGYNYSGQLGNGTFTDQRNLPVSVDVEALGGFEVVSVAAGTNHSVAKDAAGRVWAWGSNQYGQLGDGTTAGDNGLYVRLRPGLVDLSPLAGAGIASVTVGKERSFAVDDIGRLWAWGANGMGQLGDGTTVHPRPTPVLVDLNALGGGKVVSVASGDLHNILLDDAGRLWSWGYNSNGQLGDGTTTSHSAPVQVDLSPLAGAKVVSFAVGSGHSLALDEAGRLWAWGRNSAGQLGDGTTTDSPLPVAVDVSALGTAKVVSVAAGGYHSVAMDDSGKLWAWGQNTYGQLGNGTNINSLTPVAVDLTALGVNHVVSLASGESYALAVDDAGQLWAWGINNYGQLGDGTTTNRNAPVLVGLLTGGVAALSSSSVPAAVTITAGSDVLLGELSVTINQIGGMVLSVPEAEFSLGAPGQTRAAAPYGASSHFLYARCDNPGVRQTMSYRLLDQTGNLVHAGQVDVTCVADIRQSVVSDDLGGLTLAFTNGGTSDATVSFTPATGLTLSGGATSWQGSVLQQGVQSLTLEGVSCPFNGMRELGLLTFFDGSGQLFSERKVFASGPATCGAYLVAGGGHSLVVDSTNRLWAWGYNNRGQLGNGTIVNSLIPLTTDLTALGSAKLVSVAAGMFHSLALDDSGKLWAWGQNTSGQLGNGGTPTYSSTPVAVDLSGLGSAKVKAVAVGAYHSIALDDAGKLWGFGQNTYGQLGNGGNTNGLTPVAVDLSALNGARVVSVSASTYFTLALDEDGVVWAWGSNAQGQLGDGTTTEHRTPVQVDFGVLGGTKVVAVTAGGTYAVALDDTGRLWAWGENGYGQVGDGTNVNRLTPALVDLSILNGAKVISAMAALGGSHTLALDEDGVVWAWGSNGQGQLGNGTTISAFTPVAVNLNALGSAEVAAVVAGTSHNLLMDTSGRLWAWGLNTYGRLGDGTTTLRTTPVLVDVTALGETPWVP